MQLSNNLANDAWGKMLFWALTLIKQQSFKNNEKTDRTLVQVARKLRGQGIKMELLGEEWI